MDLETAQTTTTAKFPILKQENGNSFKLVAQTTTNADGTSTSLIPGPVTTEEKAQKKNDIKARSMLLMALPNEHLMTFNQYKDAKTLFAAIQTRFGGNDATKKTQKTLLKQISLPSEWNTHVVVWRNKPDLDTMSFDDLYNNFKIVKQEVKGTASSSLSLSSSSQNMAFVSSPSSTNEVNTAYGVSIANTQVSPASTQVSTASTQVSTANLSDDTVYAFLASQPNGSQLVYEDLEQIHEDDIEEMDLKWQLALLSMRTRRFFQKTGRKITINGSDTAGYDKSKVECFNCHKMGHFARECRGPRNQDSRNRNQDSSRRTVNVEETSSKAMVAIDGAGFDWSYMADDEVPTNMALMAFSDSEVHNDKTCSKTCLKSFETLKTQLDDLRIEFNKSEFNLATYKRGLASVEEQLVFYKKNEVIFCEQLAVLKRDISYKDSEISMLKSELEKLKQEKESNQLKIENFDNASKSLDKLIGSQITPRSRFCKTIVEKGGSRNHKVIERGETMNSQVLIRSLELIILSFRAIIKILEKFGLEDSKPMKTPMPSDTKLTKDEECELVDSTKYMGMIGCCLTSWFSKKQTALAISTIEAEYVSARKACQQELWMKQALTDYDIQLEDVPIMCDNKGVIDLSKNPVQHSRTKHIEICHHFLWDNVQKGNISIEKVPSEDNIVDILTKPLKREPFNYLRLGLGMMEHFS
ncbi:ribonuclease H-like domain-containing protein [Tanacetum coccineum]